MHIAFIQGTFSRLTSLLSLSLEQNPLKALSPALLTPTLQVGNNQQSITIVLCQSHPHSLWSIYARHGQSTTSHIQITEAVDHHLGDGGKRYGRHNPLSLQALSRLRQFLERAPHRWTLVAIHSLFHVYPSPGGKDVCFCYGFLFDFLIGNAKFGPLQDFHFQGLHHLQVMIPLKSRYQKLSLPFHNINLTVSIFSLLSWDFRRSLWLGLSLRVFLIDSLET